MHAPPGIAPKTHCRWRACGGCSMAERKVTSVVNPVHANKRASMSSSTAEPPKCALRRHLPLAAPATLVKPSPLRRHSVGLLAAAPARMAAHPDAQLGHHVLLPRWRRVRPRGLHPARPERAGTFLPQHSQWNLLLDSSPAMCAAPALPSTPPPLSSGCGSAGDV